MAPQNNNMKGKNTGKLVQGNFLLGAVKTAGWRGHMETGRNELWTLNLKLSIWLAE